MLREQLRGSLGATGGGLAPLHKCSTLTRRMRCREWGEKGPEW